MNKAENKRIELGRAIYDDFIGCITDTFPLSNKVSTPRTCDLEKYALLEKAGHTDLLFVEMIKEYLSNFSDVKISVEKGRLYHHFETKDTL